MVDERQLMVHDDESPAAYLAERRAEERRSGQTPAPCAYDELLKCIAANEGFGVQPQRRAATLEC